MEDDGPQRDTGIINMNRQTEILLEEIAKRKKEQPLFGLIIGADNLVQWLGGAP